MTTPKGIVDIVSRIARLLAPPRTVRPLTEDDVRSDRYLRHLEARG